jgi:hypothetical protein
VKSALLQAAMEFDADVLIIGRTSEKEPRNNRTGLRRFALLLSLPLRSGVDEMTNADRLPSEVEHLLFDGSVSKCKSIMLPLVSCPRVDECEGREPRFQQTLKQRLGPNGQTFGD